VPGGLTRAESVANGLKRIDGQTTHVLVQDAVRPFLTADLVERLIDALKSKDGVIAARRVTPTIKKVSGVLIEKTIDRGSLWEAETPQLFRAEILKEAYKMLKEEASLYTDEASLVEAIGGNVKVLDSKIFNLKITTQADYELARMVVEGDMIKTGFGYDIHRLVEGRDLVLGGVKIPFHKGSLGHSDGDVVIHALIDALCGATALGDIGELFPDTDKQYKNIASTKLLTDVMGRIMQKGFAITHIDITIVLERPKLSTYKPRIKRHLMRVLSLSEHEINIKAKTKEGLDSEGSGCAVSAFVTVTVCPQ
jgi:2-C-methyl-D-erythritol 4-phosphate cytidylyltransferase/2-C-methyl-D-erythritol 2,4-cyclodiphosphate synthase